MVEQNLPLQESLAPEVAPALIDLAQLAQRTSSTPIEGLETVAGNMLGRLLMLCAAQRGAVLLGVDEHVPSELPSSRHKTFRALALHGIDEEEAHVLLITFPAGNAIEQPDPDLACWLTYRLSIGEFMVEREQYTYGILSPQEIEKLPSDGTSPLLVRQPLHALLVLGWTAENDGECSTRTSRTYL